MNYLREDGTPAVGDVKDMPGSFGVKVDSQGFRVYPVENVNQGGAVDLLPLTAAINNQGGQIFQQGVKLDRIIKGLQALGIVV